MKKCPISIEIHRYVPKHNELLPSKHMIKCEKDFHFCVGWALHFVSSLEYGRIHFVIFIPVLGSFQVVNYLEIL